VLRGGKQQVFALGVVGLAAALTVAAFAAPGRAARETPTYTPESNAVIARVPERDPEEVARRRSLAAAPERVELAVELAREDIARYRRLSDPRYLGRAQATLARWWKLPDPPPDVLLLRATIEQSIHEFGAARADLDKLIAERPDDAQAQLVRAVVATITAHYADAQASCDAVARLASPLIATTCASPLRGLSAPELAYRALRAVYARSRPDAGVRGWALTELAELAVQQGDLDAAQLHLHQALAVDDSDAYARNLLADVLLALGVTAEAQQLLAGREAIDSHLVRMAIVEHLQGRDGAAVRAMRERIAAAAERGDRIHLREEARFTLVVDGAPQRAVTIARDNWDVQKELADARLLAECAAAAHDRAAAAPVLAWAHEHDVHDAWLDRALGGLP
jgi:tetratricopeptide (TPR) repeat protein